MNINALISPITNALIQFYNYTKQALNNLVAAIAQRVLGSISKPNPKPLTQKTVTDNPPPKAAITHTVSIATLNPTHSFPKAPDAPSAIAANHGLAQNSSSVFGSINCEQIAINAQSYLDTVVQLNAIMKDFSSLTLAQKNSAFKLRPFLNSKINKLIPILELISSVVTTKPDEMAIKTQMLELKTSLSQAQKTLSAMKKDMQLHDPICQLCHLVAEDEHLALHKKPSDFQKSVDELVEKAKSGLLNLDLITLLPADKRIASDDIKAKCALILEHRSLLIDRLKGFTNVFDSYQEGQEASTFLEEAAHQLHTKAPASYDEFYETLKCQIDQLAVAKYRSLLDRFDELYPPYKDGSGYTSNTSTSLGFRNLSEELLKELIAVMEKSDRSNHLHMTSHECLTFRCACTHNPDDKTKSLGIEHIKNHNSRFSYFHRASLRLALENLIAKHSVPKLEKDPSVPSAQDLLKELTSKTFAASS